MARVRDTLDRLRDPSVLTSINEEAHRHIRPVLASALVNCPYALTEEEADCLENLGVTVNPFAIQTHTHAAAKTEENRMLEIVGTHLPKEPSTFIFLKRSKLRYLRRAANNKDIFQNQHIEPKDLLRYDDESCEVMPECSTSTAYISDALHFLSYAQLGKIFQDSPKLKIQLATLVLPVESLHRHPSLHPAIYTLNYHKDGFEYIPGNHAGGAYFHEYSTLQWLTLGKLIIDDPLKVKKPLTLTVQLIESLGANHLLLITRGDLRTPKLRTFARDTHVLLPQIFHPKGMNANKPLSKRRAMQLWLYAKSVKEVSERDLYAKVRQLIPTSELDLFDPVEVTHLVNYLLFISHLSSVSSYDDILSSNIFQHFTIPIKNKIRELAQLFTGADQFNQLLKALDWQTFSYSMPVETIHTRAANYQVAKTLRMCRDLPCDEYDRVKDVLRQLPDGVTLFEENDKQDPSSPEAEDSEDDTDSVDFNLSPTHELPPNFDSLHKGKSIIFDTDNPSTSTAPAVTFAVGINSSASTNISFGSFTPEAEATPPPPMEKLPWDLWIPLLEQHGFKGKSKLYKPTGELICPITEIKTVPHCPFPDKVPDGCVLALKSIKRFATKMTMLSSRASAYTSDIKNNRTGKLLPAMNMPWKASLAYVTQHGDREIPGVVIHGAGGCGKSYAIQKWLRSCSDPCAATVVCPTLELRNDWLNKIGSYEQTNIKTFEKALIQPVNNVVIFDDYTKLPPGYIETMVYHHHNLDLIILTGDPMQSAYHETNRDAYISLIPDASAIFSEYCEFNINATHRNVAELACLLGVYSERQGKLTVSFSTAPLSKGKVPILVPSRMKQEAFADVGNRCMTYAGCQGLTAPKIQILIDNHTTFCSEQTLYTCLSRAVDQIHFINTGPNSQAFWTKLESTPYLKAFLDNYREEQTERLASTAPEPEVREPAAPKTHIPVESTSGLRISALDLPEKHSREIFNKAHGFSNAIQGDGVAPMFQHQQAKDETLFKATIDARLSITHPDENKREFAMKKDTGDVLFVNYKAIMNLPHEPVPFEPRLWNICKAEVQNTYLAKPIANLINGTLRQSPDFPANKIALFLKSQWVKKIEKIGAIPVKPGQTIASFMQETVMLYGTMARYLRKMRQRYQPAHIFINCEKTPEDFNKFILEHWSYKQVAHTNDFTAFDQSQDAAMLQFEVIKARYFNIPEDVIEGYIQIKLTAEIFLGTLSIMRLSGEGPTFDANTECSIAYNATRYHINEDVTQVYAGDDMAMDHVCPEKKSFKALEKKLKLTSKPLYPKQKPGDWADFCGWTITPYGIIKNPKKLDACLQLHTQLGDADKVARSYALDAKYAYDLGDRIHEVLDVDEMTSHFNVIRQLHKLHQQDVLVPPETTVATAVKSQPDMEDLWLRALSFPDWTDRAQLLKRG
uniref:RNA replication protein n=2 Tax=Cymbidium mosaic virus TaxID=12178 RepID=O37153_9VIRU|nr:RNA replicase [Cymbidium mosaic virus]